MAEAQACGAPVIGLARGGACDIVVEGRTGWLIRHQRIAELRRAIRRACEEDLDVGTIRRNAERFSHLRFRDEIRAAVDDLVLSGTEQR